MTVLIDASVLIPLAVDDHQNHETAARWFVSRAGAFATCPITQGAVVRHVVRNGRRASAAVRFLDAIAGHTDHEFWSDDIAYDSAAVVGVIGHRQVTDAYLAALARSRRGTVATLDRGFAAVHPDVAELVPTA